MQRLQWERSQRVRGHQEGRETRAEPVGRKRGAERPHGRDQSQIRKGLERPWRGPLTSPEQDGKRSPDQSRGVLRAVQSSVTTDCWGSTDSRTPYRELVIS